MSTARQSRRALVERPADLWLIVRMAAWAATLPLLKHVLRLETLARLMWIDGGSKKRGNAVKIIRLSRALTRPSPSLKGGCYERSLLAYRFLSQVGADPRLVVAVKKDGAAVRGHAWVTVAGAPADESEALDGYEPIAVYGRGGRAE